MKSKSWHLLARYLFMFLLALGSVGLYMGLLPGKAHATTFTIDGKFISNAESYVQQTETGYIPLNDCTHWLSWFLQQAYGSPYMETWTDSLANDLITNQDARVITGNGAYTPGGFISAQDAASYFDPNSGNYLDHSLIENGGSNEYLIGYKWSNPNDQTSAQADHLAVYVGNGQVVSHGITDGHGHPGYDRVPRAWYFGLGLVKNLVIIALTNSVKVHNPVVANNRDGRMEVFQVGRDGQLYHQWEDSHGNWSNWQSLGGNWPGQPAVVMNRDGRLEIFIVGNQGSNGATLFHSYQTSPGGNWTGWLPLSGVWPAGTPAVTHNLHDSLEIFMRGMNSTLYHAWQTTLSDSANYSQWYPMGGVWNTDPVVANNSDNSMQVFLIGEDRKLYYNQEDNQGNWSGWQSLDGNWPGQLAVTLNSNNELELFLVGDQGPNGAALFHSWQTSPGSSSWSGWQPLPGNWLASTPAVSINHSSKLLDVFALGQGNTPLCHDYENPDGSWSGPQCIGGYWPGFPAIATNLVNGLEVFLLGYSGEVYHAWEISPGDSSNYTGWYTLGIPHS